MVSKVSSASNNIVCSNILPTRAPRQSSCRSFIMIAFIIGTIALAAIFGGHSLFAATPFGKYSLVKATEASYRDPSYCYEGGYRFDPEPRYSSRRLISDVRRKEIQEKQDVWSYPLSLSPPMPLVRNCLKKVEIERYLNEVEEDSQTRIMQKLFDNTLTVSHEQFEAVLEYATEGFNEHLKSLEPGNRDYIITFPWTTKSERWVAEVALRYLDILPRDVVLQKDLIQSLKRNPSVRHVVVFDDAAYSCKQRRAHVVNLLEKLPNINVHSVIPFMAKKTCIHDSIVENANEREMKIFNKLLSRSYVHTALEFGGYLSTLKIFEGESEEQLESLGIPARSITYSLVFDHKLADQVSTPIEAYTELAGKSNGKYFFVSDPTPPYRRGRYT